MSAFAALKEMVEGALSAASAALHAKDDEQDQAIKALEDRVAVLEGRLSPSSAKAASASSSRSAKTTPKR